MGCQHDLPCYSIHLNMARTTTSIGVHKDEARESAQGIEQFTSLTLAPSEMR
jgi:hypothetical protein